MLCMHCLEGGSWQDEDCCPKCKENGHVSPWQVSKCPACNQEFFDKMRELGRNVGIPQDKFSRDGIQRLMARIRRLEEKVDRQQKTIEYLSSISVHQIRF